MPSKKLFYKERYETVLFDHLYQQADTAMYESKRTLGSIATFYEDIKQQPIITA